MDSQNEKIRLLKKSLVNDTWVEYVSLKDVPLEVRRKEARKPLFLTRYE